MPHSDHENPQLLIRCPSCGQRFKVGTDLRDRTVECGACEHRFRINDDVVVRTKKFYPGERGTTPSRYNRVPIAAPPPEGMQTVHYAERADFSAFEPTSPLRLIAGAGAVVLVILMALLLFFGARTGGALDGVPTANRLMMAGFGAVIAGVLLVYANPKARGRSVLGGLFCAGVLLSLPMIQTDGTTISPPTGAPDPMHTHTPVVVKDPEAERIAMLHAKYQTEPLVSLQEKLRESGSDKKAYGVYVRGMGGKDKLLVRDFLNRTLKTESSHPYQREGAYFMLISGLEIDLEKLAESVKDLGEVLAINREIGVVDIQLRTDAFEPGPMDKLADKENPAFYELNKRELESIDLDRVQKAVVRITDVEPKLYRTDIGRRLVALLKEDAVEFKDDICAALVVWADETAGAGEPAEALLKKLDAAKKDVPTSLVSLLAKERRSGAVPVVLRLWKFDTSRWESHILEFGPVIEPGLIEDFPNMDAALRKTAVLLLGKVGGRNSLTLLESARQGADNEMKVRIETAEKAIRQRQGQ